MSYLVDMKAERASINIVSWNKRPEQSGPYCGLCHIELSKVALVILREKYAQNQLTRIAVQSGVYLVKCITKYHKYLTDRQR